MFAIDNVFWLVFLSGLVGGFGHCLGMCGPIVTTYSLNLSIRRPSIWPHVLYNLGRVTTYAFLGAILGFTGAYMTLGEDFQTFQRVLMISVGVLIILFGVIIAFRLPLMKYLEGRWGCMMLGRIMPIFRGQLTPGVMFPLGAILGFIPCGLVYTALLSAIRMGMEGADPIVGMLNGIFIMLLFGVGTMPALLLVGKFVSMMRQRFKSVMYRISAWVMIICGVLFILSGEL